MFEDFVDHLGEYGIELAADMQYTLDLARVQENARTHDRQARGRGRHHGDLLRRSHQPAALTTEATAQDYWPEWILGPNLLMDTTMFGRLTDGEQWKNGFGVSTSRPRRALEATESYEIYDWAYGEEPPNNTFRVFDRRTSAPCSTASTWRGPT